MKIVSYNISLSNPQKVKQLFELDADVYVVPEIAKEEENYLPSGYKMEWNGIHYPKPFMGTNSKGLGIIWKETNGKLLADYDKSLKYAIPIIYDGKLILGFWPNNFETKLSYTKIAESIIDKYSSLFDGRDVIITGDFNLFFKPSFANIEKINNKLKNFGLESVYHHINDNIGFGNETEHTFFQKKKGKIIPFFLDYTYTNIQNIKMFGLLDFGRNFSDHVGQIIIV